ncbi:MAG: histidine phosphatase family protein [Candidatus Moranbacteria bacterium]|nr:histidine phosphatase family protein [Candidatus Moranbacteria bacterium]
MERVTVFFLIRHGEAESNTRGILDSFPGNPAFGLTEIGRRQVSLSAGVVAAEGIDALFSSPMRRTRETAEIVSEACGGLSIRFDERLRESDNGIWNGRPIDEFRERHPALSSYIDGNVEEGTEGYQAMRQRMVESVRDVLREFAGCRIALVSHGDPLEQLHGALFGETVGESAGKDSWYPETGSVTRVEIDSEIRAHLLSENR